VQLVGETPTAHRHFMFGAVRMAGQTDYAQRRLPFRDELAQGSKFTVVGRVTDDGERLRLPQAGIAYRNPDALQPKIEAEHGFHASANPCASCMPGLAGQHHRVYAQQFQGGGETFLDRHVKK
jgi:hypothetical protein